MKTRYTVLLVLLSLVMGSTAFYFIYSTFVNLPFEGVEYVLSAFTIGVFSLASGMILFVMFEMLETVHTTNLVGYIVDKLSDGCELRIVDSKDKTIHTITVSAEFFYHIAKVGDPVGYELNEGAITGHVRYRLLDSREKI